ncbi:hillarin-like [Ostrea edulis]|uniref:hillarin-like n=1 Tax=Ostrea edulis TaxID=37623 RepID=UPI0024AEA426|nr:hillarin-like [Ostrea edulis]
MGCMSSKSVEVISSFDVVITPDLQPPPTEEEPETSSDHIFIGTDDATETVKIPNELDEYSTLKPHNPINVCENREKYAKFFENWSPILQSDEDSDAISTAGNNSEEAQLKLTMEDIDKRAREAPAERADSFDNLKDYLLDGLSGHEEEEKLSVRAIIVWLGEQDLKDWTDVPPSRDSPKGFLALLAQKNSLFVTFFTVLCREFGLKCVKVRGVSKAGDYQPGEEVESSKYGDTWAAVFVNRRWQIVHPYWVCKSLVGRNAGGWIKLEENGKTIGRKEKESVGVLRKAFKEYYIFPDPDEFKYRCHPDDEKWQLTKNSVKRNEFSRMPYLFPTFFGMGLKLISANTCLLTSDTGESLIEIQAPLKNANTLDLWYELYLKEGTGNSDEENMMLQAENIPKLVAMIRCGDVWRFKMNLPIKGAFKLCCYGGPHKSPLSRIAEFRIDNHVPKKNCKIIPFNPGRVGFGPGPAATAANFFTPSHSDGQIPIQMNTKLEISFTVIKSVIEKRSIVALLHKNDMEPEELDRHVEVEIRKERRMILIRTDAPSEGEYALTIHSCVKEERAHPSRWYAQNGVNVCNYLLTTMVKQHERANQKIARKKLQDALSSVDVGRNFLSSFDVFSQAIEKCMKEKINENDNDIVSAKTKVDLLKLKNDARDAKLRNQYHVTERTLRRLKSSVYAPICAMEISELESILKKLEGERDNFL